MNKQAEAVSVIPLQLHEIETGLEYEREMAISQSKYTQADSLRTAFVTRMRMQYHVPDDYEFQGFLKGFVKP